MLRQSPVAHKFSDGEYEFTEVNAYRVPIAKITPGEIENNSDLSICDLSHLPRAGFRGESCATWLSEEHGLTVPEINHASNSVSGLVLARFSQTEFMLMNAPIKNEMAFENFIQNSDTSAISEKHPGIYYLPRQDSHACFYLGGESSSDMFSKVCAVDLYREHFSNLQIAQTSVARVGAIIIRWDMEEEPGYLLLTDSANAEYLWDSLMDAGKEYGIQNRLINVA